MKNSAGVWKGGDMSHRNIFEGWFLSEAAILEHCSRNADLTELAIRNSFGITYIPELPDSITSLEIDYCGALVEIRKLPASLRVLKIFSCAELSTVPTIPEGLIEFAISCCPKFLELPAMPSSLKKFRVYDCSGLATLPAMPAGLSDLKIEQTFQIRQVQIGELTVTLDYKARDKRE